MSSTVDPDADFVKALDAAFSAALAVTRPGSAPAAGTRRVPPPPAIASPSETGGGGRKAAAAPESADGGTINPDDFWAVLPQHRYLYVPTRDLWPAESIDGRLTRAARKHLDTQRCVVQMTWHPDHPLIIADRVVAAGGWTAHPGVKICNLYRPPAVANGDPGQAGRWRDHLRRVYPDEADHIERWLAHRVQRPGEKINHALVLGGPQGIGKDTLLEPVKAGVGPWNWSDISPTQMLGRFNGWVRAVVVRVSETRDHGEVDRFAFYDHSKAYIAAPPDVLTVDEKHLREHPVFNVMGVIFTTNHRTDGIYLPADDRRHFVAWSPCSREEFAPEYWRDLWRWYEAGGRDHVVAHLRALDLSQFDPKAPPPKTPAFLAIVGANTAPEDSELQDVIDAMGAPAALTLQAVVARARSMKMESLEASLGDRKARRSVPHKMERSGYVMVHNPDAKDGSFVVGRRRQTVYARRDLGAADQIRAARDLCGEPGIGAIGQVGDPAITAEMRDRSKEEVGRESTG